ncbi:palmitoyl-protein thioesterase [Macrolepiota fuliginosa MF-IS2]|uniref:Palmitoyl-protein thioesterase 1 n=1 Tax=Macrolepiota fuliginosa MF-IS2 TaxID=1400762 RepID=A0A9P5XLE7_9AGAR|nr:palmitoyl-protein thioesterase [Macrolepiota fuliginosa MF-IS2]
MTLWFLLHVCATSLLAAAAAASVITSPRSLVLWHGLGDSHSSPGMLEFMKLIEEVHPGMFIHSVFIEQDLSKDRRAGFYGNIDDQVKLAAEQMSSIPELEHGFDAVGLSQGGQFLRAYVERYNDPPVNNLITFGSQHMGISDIPLCKPNDFICQLARRAAKSAVYSSWAQNNLIQAQYFRDPANYGTYLEAGHFLPFINNEVEEMRNQTYAKNLASLNKLVLVIFTEDKTVVPKESAWFGSEEISDGKGIARTLSNQEPLSTWESTIIPMREQPLYTEDWIGLRELDERGDVVLESCVGEHMQMSDCWKDLIVEYAGGPL